MKRSKILDIIDEVLYDHDLDPPLDQKVSKEILRRLEKAGMLLPKLEDFVYGWELEDE